MTPGRRAAVAAAVAAEERRRRRAILKRPCGYLSTLPDGTIVKINATLVGWLGHQQEDLVGRRRLADLLTVGGRIYYETHIAPLLSMQNSVGEVSVDMATADGGRLPVLITAAVRPGHDHGPAVVRCTVFDASDRRSYERELLHARRQAERERERVQRSRPCRNAAPAAAAADDRGRRDRGLLPPRVPGRGRWRLLRPLPRVREHVGASSSATSPAKAPMAAALTSLIRYTSAHRSRSGPGPDPLC